MSKVSNALRRASEEDEKKIARALVEWEQRSDDARNCNSDAYEDVDSTAVAYAASGGTVNNRAANGDDLRAGAGIGPSIPILSDAPLKPKYRFKEAIENLLFGWDLARYEAYPLVALGQVGPSGEQYKILREQIKKICGEGGIRSLAVTSPIKGDGKTTVAANLAATMALDYEQNVLLIDADLRSPSLHRYFGVSGTPGLADYLGSNSPAELRSYVQNTNVAGLRILPAGKSSTFSSELLASDRMKTLVREIPAQFPDHQVIFDTSPVLSTSDPLVLGRLVDGLIIVVRAGKTPRGCLAEALTSLGSNKIVGVVLNGAELGMASRYYYYSSAT
jgi:protein-tyrosine kinase